MKKLLEGKKILIFAGGEIKNYRCFQNLIQKSDFIICADGGLEHARKFKIEPNLIIGDLDSVDLSKTAQKNKKFKKYPAEKNYSDTELAVSYAIRMGAKKINVLGALGKRIDHTISNIFSAGKYPEKITLIDEFAELTVYEKSFLIKGKRGDTVSLLPFFTMVKEITGKGFKYKIHNLTLGAGSRGLSNEMTGEVARVNFKRGKLLLIKVIKK